MGADLLGMRLRELYFTRTLNAYWSVVAERSSAVDSKFWCCQNVGSNPGLAGCGACVLEQDT